MRCGPSSEASSSRPGHERDDLAGAAQHLDRATDLGEENGLPQNPYRSRVAAARIRLAEGDPDAALQFLVAASRLYASDFSPDVRPIEALTARVWIAQGRLPEAMAWARERGLSAADDLGYVREFEHVTLARRVIGGFANSLDPDVVIIGGGAASALGERFLSAIRSGVTEVILSPAAALPVVPSVVGPSAGVVGAGLLALEADGARL